MKACFGLFFDGQGFGAAADAVGKSRLKLDYGFRVNGRYFAGLTGVDVLLAQVPLGYSLSIFWVDP